MNSCRLSVSAIRSIRSDRGIRQSDVESSEEKYKALGCKPGEERSCRLRPYLFAMFLHQAERFPG